MSSYRQPVGMVNGGNVNGANMNGAGIGGAGVGNGNVNGGHVTKPRTNPSAGPVSSYAPNELTIPETLYDKIPNLDLYKKLVEAERDVDLVATRKELDFHVLHAKSLQPSNFKKQQGILRMFIYNISENQPWQKQLDQQQGKNVNMSEEGSWTLKIEGKFISDQSLNSEKQQSQPETISDGSKLKFSSFLNNVSIDLVANENYPNINENNSNIIEWRDEYQQFSKNVNSFDGFNVKRFGIFNLHAKILINVKNDASSKLKLSDKMSLFVGKTESTQQDLIYSIWQYILFKDLIIKKDINKIDAITNNTPGINEINSLKDSAEKDLTIIKCDDVLKDLLEVEQFKFTELYQLINKHFKPKDPIVLNYEINTKKSSTLGETIIDLPIELPIDLNFLQKEVNDRNKAIFSDASSTLSNISSLNSKIALGINQLNNLNFKYNFFKQLNEDPVEFIKNWTKVQLETLKSLKSDEGYDEEIVRRSQFFEENEDLLKEKIDLLLGSTHY